MRIELGLWLSAWQRFYPCWMADERDRDSERAPDVLGFEEVYADDGGDLGAVPWATLAAHPVLVAWLDHQAQVSERRALAVGCGLGDDAEELANRGKLEGSSDRRRWGVCACRRRGGHRRPGGTSAQAGASVNLRS